MRTAFFLVAFLCAIPQSTPDRAYELKGEFPGMTLKEFKSNHKDADCSRRTSRITNCRAYVGVSFAGMQSFAYKGCALPECLAQGITANFFDDKLVSLSYGVSGSYNDVVKILKDKFGPPTEESAEGTKWKNSIGYLWVSKLVVFGPDGTGRFVGVRVASSLNDTGAAKDT